MATVTCLLVLACAVAISAQPLYCNTINTGASDGIKIELEVADLQPGIADWNIKAPELHQCVITGASAKVCDYDSTPNAFFVEFNNLYVHRIGQLQGYGTAKVTVNCQNPYGQTPLLTDSQYGLTNQYDQLPSPAKTLVLKPY